MTHSDPTTWVDDYDAEHGTGWQGWVNSGWITDTPEAFEKNGFAVRRPMAYDDSWLPRLSAFVDDSLPPVRFICGMPEGPFREPTELTLNTIWTIPEEPKFGRLVDRLTKAAIEKRERELTILVDDGVLELYYGPVVPLCLRPIPAKGVE